MEWQYRVIGFVALVVFGYVCDAQSYLEMKPKMPLLQVAQSHLDTQASQQQKAVQVLQQQPKVWQHQLALQVLQRPLHMQAPQQPLAFHMPQKHLDMQAPQQPQLALPVPQRCLDVKAPQQQVPQRPLDMQAPQRQPVLQVPQQQLAFHVPQKHLAMQAPQPQQVAWPVPQRYLDVKAPQQQVPQRHLDVKAPQQQTLFQGLPLVYSPQWSYSPVREQQPTQATVSLNYESQRPMASDVVKAECGESSVVVEVQKDLLGDGQLETSDITLGTCMPTRQGSSAQTVVFDSVLQGCGSTLTMTNDMLVYTFTLSYKPKASGATPIIRVNDAVVSISCSYLRKHNVSSNALTPTWIPFRSTEAAENILDSSLRLMTDDWQMERASNVFFLGDVMNIEASVVVANHQALRVFVDSCVATLEPDANAFPRYAFIENHGCLIDGKLMHSRSKFMPRTQDEKLQLQLDAFRFFQDTRSPVYITCSLKATAASTDAQYKACSFATDANRWMAAGENDQVCDCCDTSCGSSREGRSLVGDAALQWKGEGVLGPIFVQEKLQMDNPKVMTEAQSSPLKAEDHSATGFSPESVILAGVVAALGLVCITVLGTVLFWRREKRISIGN